MTNTKMIPLSLAIAATLGSIPAFAADSELEALTKRIQELEERIETNEVQTAETQETVSALNNVKFSGYARYGAAFDADDSKYVEATGAVNGNSTGRLGNEGNGGEFEISTSLNGAGGTKWDIGVMLDHYEQDGGNAFADGDTNLKKAYVGVTGVFDSQQDLYLWAGRVMHQRPATGLNDYFWMMHDGQGAGFENLDLGGVDLDMGFIAAVDNGYTNDNGRYAITSKLHGMTLFDAVDFSLYTNYGFASSTLDGEEEDGVNSYQVGTVFSMNNHNLILRYSDNAIDSAFDLNEGQKAMLVSFDGSIPLSSQAAIEYLAQYQTIEEADNVSNGDRTNYSVIVRPTYAWNDVHSTWLETGYSVVDFDDLDAENSAWKVTLSQNISFDAPGLGRPMLRFYTTVGNSDTEATYNEATKYWGSDTESLDTVTVGAMFEASW